MLPEIPDALRLQHILLILVPFAIVMITVLAITYILTRESARSDIRISEEGLTPYDVRKYQPFAWVLSIQPRVAAPCVH